MIYNLSKLISDNSAIVPVTNGYDANSDDEAVGLIQSGGTDNSRGLKVDYTVQCLSRSKDKITALRQIQVVYDLIANRFGIGLPEVTVKGTLYPAVTVGQMIPLQLPSYIGTDQNALHEWTVNFMVTTRR